MLISKIPNYVVDRDKTIRPPVGIDLRSSHCHKRQLERYLENERNARHIGIALVLAAEFEEIINNDI